MRKLGVSRREEVEMEWKKELEWVEKEVVEWCWEIRERSRNGSKEVYDYVMEDVDVGMLKECEFERIVDWADNGWGTRGSRIERSRV